MTRWYDYIVVFVAADLLLGNIKVALLAPSMLGNLIGVAGVYAIWHLFNEIYIPYRLKKEDEDIG